EGNNDAAERLEAVSETCWRYQIPFGKETYACGNYTNMSGFNIVDRYLAEHDELPDAFVAANDLMAFGAIARLKTAGYQIPRDVIVTGYDHSAFATIHRPGLTTVERGEKECGSTAYGLLESFIRYGIWQDSVVIEGKAVFNGSCGCEDINAFAPEKLSEVYVMRGLRQNNKHHYLKLLMAEATGLHSFDDFLNAAKTFLPLINPKEMYICIKGDKKEYLLELNNAAENIPYGRDISDYMDNTSVTVAWKEGRFLPPRVIATSDLIPKDYIREDRFNVYLFQPLHHQERCFGYVVYANDVETIVNDPFVSMFSLIISSALETILRQDTMRTIMGKLDKMSTTDGLTGVMTRAGAREKWPELQMRTEVQGMKTGVIFADLDGLKKVNDKYGHEEGDRYIVMVSDIMKKLPLRDGFVYRYGGDELVAVCSVSSEEEVQEYIAQINASVDEYNKRNPIAYTSRVSLGYCVSAGRDLDELIRIADKKMYVDKKKAKS
ncbi:MAG: GGDEF domain-containing protein, partial [Clostridia bacterium]|nr:GGDEF domain-containing protein [Clostridia bacterium]